MRSATQRRRASGAFVRSERVAVISLSLSSAIDRSEYLGTSLVSCIARWSQVGGLIPAHAFGSSGLAPSRGNPSKAGCEATHATRIGWVQGWAGRTYEVP